MYKKIDLTKLIIYDIETSVNAIIVCCLDYATGSKKEFVIYDDEQYEDQPLELYKFLRSCIKNGYTFFGFNVLNFDSQVIHKFYKECEDIRYPLYEQSATFIVKTLYDKAQSLINSQDTFGELVYENRLFAPHIDVYRQLHYDRPAKATSLKWVEFSMRNPVIKEMPHDHTYFLNKEELLEVVDYCWEDVKATHSFYEKVKFETEVRLELSHEFDLNLINASEPKMVREIFGKFLCEEMGITMKELKELKTYRSKIAFKDIIFPYIKFQTKEFQDVLDVFNSKILDASPTSTDTFFHSFPFHEMEVVLGLGGIHACVQPGVYEPKEGEVLEDADGTSFYPFLAIRNDLRPEHLGAAFSKVYALMYEKRTQYSKKDPKNYIFKIILNSAYGLSKEINGYLYDPKMTYSITLNGQLSLLMLAEALHMSVPGIKFIQFNTDGITYVYKEEYKSIVEKICKWWEDTTKINLEFIHYSKMIVRDVNSYTAQYTDGTLKRKGIFDYNLPYHKNPSALIVPKAIEAFFIDGKDPADFIKEDHSVYDYCLGVKKKSNFKLNLIQNYNYAQLITEQQKVCRFIIAKSGEESGALVKDYNDGRRIGIAVGSLIQPLDTITDEKATSYNIDYEYYIKKAREIIEAIKPSIVQTKLF